MFDPPGSPSSGDSPSSGNDGPPSDPDLPTEPYVSNCAQCTGLCCVASGFQKSDDFGFTKAPGRPCRHLDAQFRCGIHPRLSQAGFPGCVSFDCYGAGQRLTARRSDGADWRDPHGEPSALFTEFFRLLGVCELGHHIAGLLERTDLPPDQRPSLEAARTRVRAAESGNHDVGALRQDVRACLAAASHAIRAVHTSGGADLSRQMLPGAAFAGRNLSGANLFAACLIGADLRGADLRCADLLGTDLRGADLRGADLRGALFLTRGQVVRTRTDARTLGVDAPR